MAESKPKNQSPKEKPKVFDVAHPSKNVEPSTSKPVIVGHTNSMKRDPMVSPVEQPASASGTPAQEAEVLDKPKREMTIQPIVDSTGEQKSESGVKESFDIPEEQPTETTEETPSEEPEAEAEIEELPAETGESGEEEPAQTDENGDLIVDAIVAGVNTKKERKDQEEKEAKLAEEIQGLINSKKYYVKTHLPPGKRNLRWLIVLLILAVLAGGGWYLYLGPGKELWSSGIDTQTAAPVVETNETKQESQKKETPAKDEPLTFKNPAIAISFTYPKDWKVETAKDTEFPARDVITLTSPAETIKISVNGAQAADAEVYLRTRIFVENTVNPIEYASDLAALASCSTEDFVAGTTPLKFIYVDTAAASPNVSQVSIGPDNCTAAGASFMANDQIQLAAKKNTYVIYTEYIFSEAHLKKNGTVVADAIILAQESGITTTKDAFKAGKKFAEFQELVKSFKEL